MTRNVLLALVVCVALVPGAGAAKTDVGPTIVVGSGETIDDDLTVAAGTVVVEGTIQGDLTALAGSVIVTGDVTGDVVVFGGRIQVYGRVDGDVRSYTVNSLVNGTVVGDYEGLVGALDIGGRVGGNVEIFGIVITVEQSGQIDGALRSTTLSTNVDGTVGEDATNGQNQVIGTNPSSGSDAAQESLPADRSATLLPMVDEIATGPLQVYPGRRPGADVTILDAYGFLVNLFLGILLVGLFPRSSRAVAATVYRTPIRTVGAGLLALIGIPIVLLLVVLSLFGIPLAFIGLALWISATWIASVYGRFAIGMIVLWVTANELERADVEIGPIDNRWVGLLLGFLLVALFVRFPLIGDLVDVIVLAAGFGALARLAYVANLRVEQPEGVEPVRPTESKEEEHSDRDST